MSDSEDSNAASNNSGEEEEEEEEQQEGSGSGQQSGSGDQSDGSQKGSGSQSSKSKSGSGSDQSGSGSDSQSDNSKKKKKKNKKKNKSQAGDSQKKFFPKKDCFSKLQSVLEDLDGLALELDSFAIEMRIKFPPKRRDFSAQKVSMKDQSIQNSNNSSSINNNRMVGPPSIPLQQFKWTPSPTGSPSKYIAHDTQNHYSSAGVSTIRRSISQQRDPYQGSNYSQYKKPQKHVGRFNSSYQYAELPQPPLGSQNRPFLKNSNANDLYQTPEFDQRMSNKFSRFKEPPISFGKNPEFPRSLQNHNNNSSLAAPPLINPPQIYGNTQPYYKSPYNPAQFTGTGGYRKTSPDWHRVGDFYRNQSNFKKQMRQSFEKDRSQLQQGTANHSFEGNNRAAAHQSDMFQQVKMPASNQQIESAVNTLLK